MTKYLAALVLIPVSVHKQLLSLFVYFLLVQLPGFFNHWRLPRHKVRIIVRHVNQMIE